MKQIKYYISEKLKIDKDSRIPTELSEKQEVLLTELMKWPATFNKEFLTDFRNLMKDFILQQDIESKSELKIFTDSHNSLLEAAYAYWAVEKTEEKPDLINRIKKNISENNIKPTIVLDKPGDYIRAWKYDDDLIFYIDENVFLAFMKK